MASESPLALACTRIPDFHHAVFAAGDKAQVVGCQSPDAFNVAEECADAGLRTRCVGVCEGVGGEHDEGVCSVGVRVLLLCVRLRSVSIPEPDCGVESSGEHIAGWRWTFRVLGPKGNGLRRDCFVMVVCGADTASIIILVASKEGVVIELELWRHELELLYLTDVAFKDFQALLRVKVPKSDCQVI
jgi:hypothetical protein